MTVIRYPETLDNPVSYVATLAFFCCVSCVILMLKFGRFKASLNFYDGKRKSHKEHGEIGSVVSLTGAYRTNRDEFFGYNYPEGQRKVTPSLVPVTNTEQPTRPIRQVKSTSDLIKNKNLPPNLRQDDPGVSQDPRGAETNDTRNNKNPEIKLDAHRRVDKKRLEEQKKLEKKRLEEQKKLEKQRLEEQKKRDKLALQEQAKQEKLRKETEKKEAQQAKKDKKKKKPAPQRPVANASGQGSTSTTNNPIAQGLNNPVSQGPNKPIAQGPNNPIAQGPNNPLAGQMQYSSNTLESSISKTSGPPPYTENPKPEGNNDNSSNVTYSKPVDTGSWDMVSKHRENINRAIIARNTTPTKQTTLDMNYKVDQGNVSKENSEA